ncbi:MAG: serine/threonine-protein kinase [Gemmataceae bacterium]
MSASSTRGYDSADLGPHPTTPNEDAAAPQIGQYRLLARLGQGGMGEVYRARHVRLKRNVAIKFLRQNETDSERLRQRFLHEMEALGRLDHVNVVRATDAGDWHGHPFLVMEELSGADLFHLVRSLGPLSVPDACALIRQACLGLEYAHAQGLIHRDIKPSNLYLCDSGVVKLLDLGLVRLGRPLSADELTRPGELLGTFDYMAPEQASNSHEVDGRADLYSLGCTIHFLLIGRPPFQANHLNVAQKVLAHAQTPPPPLHELRPETPGPLSDIVLKLLAKRPEQRFATPRELSDALAGFAVGADLVALIASYRDKTPEQVRPGEVSLPFASSTEQQTSNGQTTLGGTLPQAQAPPRRRRLAPLLLGVFLAAIAIAAFFWFNRPGGEPDAPKGKNDPNDLLALAPTVLESGKKFSLVTKPDQRELHFDTDRPCFIRLGEAAGALDLEIVLHRNLPMGTAGAFLGYQSARDKKGIKRATSVLFTYRFVNRGGVDIVDIRLDRHWLTDEPRGGDRTVFNVDIPARPPYRPEHRVRVRVEAGKLTRLLFDHQDFTDRLPPDAPVGAELTGPFGVYADSGATFVTSARLNPPEEK